MRFALAKAPDEITLKFPRPGIVTLRAMDGVSKRPLAGVMVEATENGNPFPNADHTTSRPEPKAVSDAQGVIRLLFAGSGSFRLVFDSPTNKLIAPAIEGLDVSEGETQKLNDVVFTPGAVVRGQLVHETTREPIRLKKDESATISARDLQSPLGTSSRTARVGSDGSFEIRLAPGLNQLRLWNDDHFISPNEEIELKEGEIKKLEFPVSRRQRAGAK